MLGKLIVLYGVNNLGKTTQAKLLVESLAEISLEVDYLKYPLYDSEPTGPFLNDYLRGGNNHELTVREFQLLQMMNRTQYDSELRRRLKAANWIVAEDYIGTGIAWGMGGGVERGFLEKLNQHLVPADLGILFQGERYMEAQEKDHQHETNNDLTEKVRLAHEELADAYGWLRVNASGTIEEVRKEIWKHVNDKFKL